MVLKELINENDYIKVYELNNILSANTLYGALLYKGGTNCISENLLNRKVIKMFEFKNANCIEFIVENK